MKSEFDTPRRLTADNLSQINFTKGDGLVPVVVQDAYTHVVLMLGYMNAEAVSQTLEKGKVTFFSRSKNRLWTKGEESGNFLNLKELLIDCDNDTILAKAEPKGPTCHTGADTCFNESNAQRTGFIDYLRAVIAARKGTNPEESYTAKLFVKGINKVAQKVGEEAVELVIEAKDDNRDLFVGEAADLLFHYLVLLEAKEIPLEEIIGELESRHRK
ncbi:MAG TPA: bifunctional phosphoribosyl-AMP cyclohydrolase/phosphoribosyl-ATP diphosphatase [Cytophagales bacterium]|nr:bifunctional phosphoribosyl-AMP cyclohydrolase/phosphoribosyl-ATP diphosphatase [Cytophagales bacterium]HAA20026.1 bifunctional phosphoribosyl-AMP cyclohydrolase/phosphoribosyl-ATP diphosphatase [Cytophagales bacterium]HAP61134.1 bifunctional phosphoribosyl-AMP cyclohydrolase/phosphoribosyl-ATP diphosphatase [Cytophagales bacterium]